MSAADFNNQALVHYERFQRYGELADIKKAIEHATRAIDMTPDGHPDLPSRLANLGTCYRAQFVRLGDLNDIEQAIEHLYRALVVGLEDHMEFPTWLNNLGLAHYDRFNHLGTLEDLVNATEYASRAVNATPFRDPGLAPRLHNLGFFYRARFLRLGKLSDIDRAIMRITEALDWTLENHPNYPMFLSNLALCNSDRYDYLGTPEDLVKAIRYRTQVVELTPDDHPNLPLLLNNLGMSHRTKYYRTSRLDSLEKAIELMSRAVTLAPGDDINLSLWLNNLASCYADRYDRLNIIEDLVNAIEYQTKAINLTPEGHPSLPVALSNLGLSYRARFLRLGEPGDIARAITDLSRALSLTPNDHPERSIIHWNLAGASLSQYERMGNPSHLQHSLDHFRQGSQPSTGSPRERFRCTRDWAKYASLHNSPDSMEAYHAAMNQLPQFVWLGATASQRYHDLAIAENLAINAASAAVLHSDPALALEWLEHGRCVVWSQGVMLRSPLIQLHSAYPGIAASLQKVSERLHEANSSTNTSTIRTDSYDPELVSRERRSLATEYEDLLATARSLPGFENILLPIQANALVRAPRNGPAVVINCHRDRCDALIVVPEHDAVQHLPLPHYNQEKAQNARYELQASLSSKGIRERGFKVYLPSDRKDGFAAVLRDLWIYVVKPVLDFLGFTNNIRVEGSPHITWCPTGAMTFLPLHAAGDYEQTQSAISDYAISSYTPTLTALLQSTPSQLTCASRVLAIAQVHTPGHASLPGTEAELDCVKEHIQSKAKYSQLTDEQATTTTVLDAMEQHDWLHIACHAHQNVDDSSKSGFYLHDGTLDLETINKRSFRSKGLAFLSACQTATGDETLPDEAIHLASGMLMAGYSSVIATMWSVKDDDAPFIADNVYAELMKEGKVGNGEAGTALHLAVEALREKVGVKDFSRWVPYIHIGS